MTSYTLDNLGRVTAITDPSSDVTSQEFDSRNRLTKVTQDADGAGPRRASVFLIAYNAAGQKTSETDPRGYVTGYSYDSRGLLSKVSQAGSGRIRTLRFAPLDLRLRCRGKIDHPGRSAVAADHDRL